jgi:cyclin-dependent kinase 2
MNQKLYQKKFEKISKIGEGSYGSVYKVILKEEIEKKDEEKTVMALKKFDRKFFREGMDFTALREITILKELSHKNIVKVNKYKFYIYGL